MVWSEVTAIAATVLLSGLAVFQVLLAAGLPLGRYAWGGQHDGVLPSRLRWSSLAAVPILALAAWVVLSRAGLVWPEGSPVVRIAVWVFSAYFGLNTVMNLLSRSMAERVTMTPVSTILVVCFVAVAIS